MQYPTLSFANNQQFLSLLQTLALPHFFALPLFVRFLNVCKKWWGESSSKKDPHLHKTIISDIWLNAKRSPTDKLTRLMNNPSLKFSHWRLELESLWNLTCHRPVSCLPHLMEAKTDWPGLLCCSWQVALGVNQDLVEKRIWYFESRPHSLAPPPAGCCYKTAS